MSPTATIRSTWNDAEKKWYFSVADVVEALTDSTDVKQYIKRMRHRDHELNAKGGTICTPLEMAAADGRRRKIQAANVGRAFADYPIDPVASGLQAAHEKGVPSRHQIREHQ